MSATRACDVGPLDKFSLHCAAMRADDAEVRRLVDSGEDINALDSAGRTVIACAIVGENSLEAIDAFDASIMTPKRLNVLRILLRHPSISLFTLNAPQQFMKGVTPLGIASWLNMVDGVQTLLEESSETVSVDGMDTSGATALMYAARDGNLAVVQQLLIHGARPDFRDILWLCEGVLRRHRWRENKSVQDRSAPSSPDDLLSLAFASLPLSDIFTPPPLSIFSNDATLRLTNTLIRAIYSSELSFLFSLLFSPSPPPSSPSSLYPVSCPVLVNLPDSKGWSPIHYCASLERPSIDVLDALYYAGADVSLFTTREYYTPLHCLARSTRQSMDQFDSDSSLYQFAVHLIRHLQAPLSALDKREETCIHIAAEHGDSLDLLLAFLDCDVTGSVRQLRNSRGLTPLEVAKPECRAAFGVDADKARPASRISLRTIRPKVSFSSISSLWRVPIADAKQTDYAFPFTSPKFDASLSSNQLLANLRMSSPSLDLDVRHTDINRLELLNRESTQIGASLFRYFRSRTESASQELQDAYSACDSLATLLNTVKVALEKRSSKQEAELLVRGNKKNRDSEDSQLTVVSTDSGYLEIAGLKSQSSKPVQYRHISVSTDIPVLDYLELGPHSLPWPDWLESFIHSDSPVCNTRCEYVEEPASDVCADNDEKAADVHVLTKPKTLTKMTTIDEAVPKVHDDIQVEKGHAYSPRKRESGTARLKAWLKRKIMPDRLFKFEMVWDLEDDGRVGREVKPACTNVFDQESGHISCFPTIPASSHIALAAASRDLDNIRQSMATVEHFIEASNQFISRAERTLARALKNRDTSITDLRLRSRGSSFDDLFHRYSKSNPSSPISPSSRPGSTSSRSSVYSSAQSSRLSFSSTLAEGDDQDTKALRRLLLRKIEASVRGAQEEIDKVSSWLRIVKETIRGVKRRGYL